MSVYMTEDEQLDQIKKWWNKYGNLITTVLSVIMFCFAGYRYWDWHQQKIQQQASSIYESMMVALSNDQVKSVKAYANELINDYNSTVYSDAAHLTLAKLYIDKEQFSNAQSELQNVINKTVMLPLKQIAKIRIARLLAEDKEYTKALEEISSIDDKTYLPVVNELKGDIYGALGQYENAMSAYSMAISEVKSNGMGNLFLEMKSNELANKNQSVTNNDKAIKAA